MDYTDHGRGVHSSPVDVRRFLENDGNRSTVQLMVTQTLGKRVSDPAGLEIRGDIEDGHLAHRRLDMGESNACARATPRVFRKRRPAQCGKSRVGRELSASASGAATRATVIRRSSGMPLMASVSPL